MIGVMGVASIGAIMSSASRVPKTLATFIMDERDVDDLMSGEQGRSLGKFASGSNAAVDRARRAVVQ